MTNVEDIYPASPMQQGMLFHTLQAPGSGIYVEQAGFLLAGDLDPAAFRRAWEAVVHRHATLRTAFVWEKLAEPRQVVRREVTLPWDDEDWRTLDADAIRARLDERLRADRETGFVLSRAPLMRCRLIALPEGRFQFLWTVHHLVLDGWSTPLVRGEVMRFYQAFRDGRGLRLDPPIPFRRYIEWLGRQDMQACETFWRDQLRGFAAPTPVRPDRLRPDARAPSEVRTADISLSEDMVASLRAFAARENLVLNTLVQAAWAVLLGRRAESDDVLFGATVAGRPSGLPGVEGMIGLFINTLPVRVRIPRSTTVRDWLRALQRARAELMPFEYSPLAQVQQWSELPAGTRLFETVLVFENYPADPAARDAASSPARVDVRRNVGFERTNYPLTLLAIPGARLVLRMLFETAWFAAEEVERMLDQMRTLLMGLCANPDAPVSTLPLLSAEEETQVLRTWQGPAVAWPEPATVVEQIEAQAVRCPDAIAVVAAATGATLTYAALDREATRVAWALHAAGVGPEARVGVWCERGLELLVALVGVLKAGAIYVPLDPTYPEARLALMVTDARLQCVLTSDAMPPVPGGADVPRLTMTVGANGPTDAAADDAVNRAEDAVAAGPARGPRGGRHAAQQGVSLLYTSGSTGRPKGVVTTQAGLANRLRWMQAAYALTAADRVLQKTPVSFDVAGWELFWPLTAGAQLVLLAPGVAGSTLVASTLRTAGVTVCHFVPSMLRLLAAEAAAEARGAPLRLVVCSGEALTGADVASAAALWPGVAVENLYGPTEASIDVTRAAGEAGPGSVPLGRPISNTQVYVCDDAGQATAVGVPGELYLGGVGLAREYWGQPAATAARFVPDPWGTGTRLYRTGDRGWWRADGLLMYGGRRDGQVKLRGVRIELGEVETVVGAHAAVAACVARVWRDQLVAYVVPREAGDLPESALRAWARARLPEAMTPGRFIALATLPRLPNGKVARDQLPAPDASSAAAAPIAPRDPLELQLALIWEQTLRLSHPVGVRDSFYELGGNSMQALSVVARIDRDLGASIALADLTEAPTVEQLAARLRDRSSRRRSTLVTFRSTGAGLPFFCVHPAGGNVACYTHLARELGADHPFHGLQASGLDLQSALHRAIPDMAATYVDELRAARPHGPYVIGGWSTGGIVAFDVAQQLIAQGETVALLVLFDVKAPGVREDEAERVEEGGEADDLAVPAIADALGVPLDSLRALDPDQQFDRLVEAAQASNRLPPGIERAYARRLLEVFHANVRAARRYTATRFPGKIVLFASTDGSGTPLEQEAADMGWGRLAPDVRVRRVAGTHRTMMTPPHIQSVAHELRACLVQALEESSQVGASSGAPAS